MPLLKPSLLRFKFDSFRDLPCEPGANVDSEQVIDAHGNSWRIRLFPGGDFIEEGEEPAEDPAVGLYLVNVGPKAVAAQFTFILRNVQGKVRCEKACDCRLLELGEDSEDWLPAAQSPRAVTTTSLESLGVINASGVIFKRSQLLNEDYCLLANGALLVDVELQYQPEKNSLYTPPSSLGGKMLQLLENDEDADTEFKVGEETIFTHRLILKTNAPVLFDSCDEYDGDSPILIDGITPEVFRIVLRYVYGEEAPNAESIINYGKDIINAANRFGVVGLKLVVEAALVESSAISGYNAVEWLIFSDAMTCPLLKEYAMSICVLRAKDVFNSESSQELLESPELMKELINEISMTPAIEDGRFDDGSKVSVDELKRQLHEKGLDLDGSKAMLVSRLQESTKRQD